MTYPCAKFGRDPFEVVAVGTDRPDGRTDRHTHENKRALGFSDEP